MSEGTDHLESMLNEMNDKFESSFANQSADNNEPTEDGVTSDCEDKKLLETQPQTPLKVQTHLLLSQNGEQMEFVGSRELINEEQKNNQNQKSLNENLNECELELSYSPQKLELNLQTKLESHYLMEGMQTYEKILDMEGESGELQEELITYQSLTQKFEVALTRLKHSQSISHNLNDFAARQEHYLRKKTTQLNLLREEKEKQVSKVCTAKPLINSRSQQLLVNHKPIQSRYQTIIEEKKKKVERQMAQKMARKIQEEQQELNQIRQYQEQLRKKLGNSLRSQEDYYNNMKTWVQRRDKKIEDLAQKKKEEAQQEVTFKPVINQKSEIIMKKNTSRVPIYDKVPMPKKGLVDSNCTFKPNLTKKPLKK